MVLSKPSKPGAGGFLAGGFLAGGFLAGGLGVMEQAGIIVKLQYITLITVYWMRRSIMGPPNMNFVPTALFVN